MLDDGIFGGALEDEIEKFELIQPVFSSSNLMPTPKVLLVANTSWYLYNFRLPLIRDLRGRGIDVALVAPHDAYTPMLEAEGFTVHPWLVARSSVNPLSEAHALIDLLRIYRREKPDLVHHFTIKACLYGTVAAKGARVYRVINAVTGLGHVFLGTRKRSRLLRKAIKPVYRAAFNARRSMVVFQNADDQEKLIQLGLTDGEHARLIRGSGVDINRFKPSADSAGQFHVPLQLLFPSRLIREKGIAELLQACRSLWADGVELELLVAGALDSGYRCLCDPARQHGFSKPCGASGIWPFRAQSSRCKAGSVSESKAKAGLII